MACMGRREIYAGLWWVSLKAKDVSLGGRIILKWSINKYDWRASNG
jgi:hypothetical protein